MDAEKQTVNNKTVNNLNFKGDDDGDLIELCIEYKKCRPGLTLKAAIRNYLFETLPAAIDKIKAEKPRMAS